MRLAAFLDRLNLNRYEKEAILHLSKVDHADAQEIYKKTKIPKGRIYSILNSLKEKGFVKIIPTTPKQYKIENIKQALKQHLTTTKTELDKKIEDIKKLELQPKTISLRKNAPSVYTLTGRQEHLDVLISLRSKAQKNIIQIAPLFIGTFASNKATYDALERGIKVRVITKKVTKENKKNIKECIKLGAQIKTLNSKEMNYFLIKDKKEFIIGLENYQNKEERLSLLSKNNMIRTLLEQYFEKQWKKAKKINTKELR